MKEILQYQDMKKKLHTYLVYFERVDAGMRKFNCLKNEIWQIYHLSL